MLADDEATFGTTNGPLCLDAPSCRELCEATTGCSGYAMSKGLNRCFLSTGGDKQYTPDYDLFTKKATAPCRTVADFMVIRPLNKDSSTSLYMVSTFRFDQTLSCILTYFDIKIFDFLKNIF